MQYGKTLLRLKFVPVLFVLAISEFIGLNKLSIACLTWAKKNRTRGLLGNSIIARRLERRGNYADAIEFYEDIPRGIPFACYLAERLAYCYFKCEDMDSLLNLRIDYIKFLGESSPYIDKLIAILSRQGSGSQVRRN